MLLTLGVRAPMGQPTGMGAQLGWSDVVSGGERLVRLGLQLPPSFSPSFIHSDPFPACP